MNTEKQRSAVNGVDQDAHSNGNGRANRLREYSERVAKTISNGPIRTFVIPVRTVWGEYEFRVKQVREGVNHEFSDLIRDDELWDAIRGLYQAREWIKKRQRVSWWKVLVAGLM